MKPNLKHAQFHLTNKCNLNCLFCWCHNNKNKYEEVSSQILMNYLKDICNMHPEVITISGGGEPTYRIKLLLQMIKFIKNRSKKISGVLITNGTLFTEYVVEELIKAGWDDIILSLQGSNSKINDFIMGQKGAYEKALKGINLINKTKKRMNKEKPILNLKTVITKHNYQDILNIINLAKKLNIQNVEFRMVNEEENEKGKYNLSVVDSEFKKLKDLVKKSKNYSKNLNVNVDFEFKTEDSELKNIIHPSKTKSVQKNICSIPFKELVVFGNGTISVCCNYFKEQFKAKSKAIIKDTKKSIKEIWLKDFQKMRNELHNEKLYALCKKCSQDMKYHNENIQEK